MTMLICVLTEMGREIGLVDDERWARFEIKKNQFDNEMKRLDSIKLKPVKETNAKVEEMGFKPLTDAVTAKESFAVQKFLTKM